MVPFGAPLLARNRKTKPVQHFLINLVKRILSCTIPFKARANARNIVGPNMLRAFAHHVVCCCVLLRVVATCWKLLDEV